MKNKTKSEVGKKGKKNVPLKLPDTMKEGIFCRFAMKKHQADNFKSVEKNLRKSLFHAHLETIFPGFSGKRKTSLIIFHLKVPKSVRLSDVEFYDEIYPVLRSRAFVVVSKNGWNTLS